MGDRTWREDSAGTGAAFGPMGLGQQLPERALEGFAREVITRLANRETVAGKAVQQPPSRGVLPLCHALVATDPNAAEEIVARLQDDGCSLDQLYLDKLAPAARQLGLWWDENEVTFAEVTIGISRIYALMRHLRDAFPLPIEIGARRAVFASVPREDHTLGVTMAADLFRQEGWDIDLLIGLDHDALVEAILDAGTPLIGLSAGCEETLGDLARLVVALRVSQPGSRLLISGHLTETAQEVVSQLGADATASSVAEAMAALEVLRHDAGALGQRRA